MPVPFTSDPYYANLQLRIGDDETIDILVRNEDLNFVDITGYTFYFTVKTLANKDAADATAVIAIDWSTHANPTSGYTVLTIPKTQTALLVYETDYLYDIQFKDTSGVVKTVAFGTLEALQQITLRTL